MFESPTLRERIESLRPSGAPRRYTRELVRLVADFRDRLEDCVDDIESDVFLLDDDELEEWAIALTELAEDLHADIGIWRSLEAYHQEFFGVALPLLCQPGEAALETFDFRRFQFFLYGIWWCFRPDHILSPEHPGFRATARFASEYFSKAFAALPRRSPVSDFLAEPNRRGWDVKRKLVWLGTRSYLFRFAFEDAMRMEDGESGDEIGKIDDFVCQQCTEWSGLGAVDVLAAALDLPDADRAVLRGWHERHAAFYRIDALNIRDQEVETLDVLNLINDEPYCIRLEMSRPACPFREGQMIFGSLTPWRGEWYWSGTQRPLASIPEDFASTRREFCKRHSSIVYRYCPDMEHRARAFDAEYFADFMRFYGSDLAVFRDDSAAVAAEQERLRIFSEIKAGGNLEKIRKGHEPSESERLVDLAHEDVATKNSTALFYHEGEGVEMLTGYGTLLSGLKKKEEPLTWDEADILRKFIESTTISPAFVRRVIRHAGSSGLEHLYFLPEGADGIEYLLRRFKGCYYRKRYPCISLHE